MLKSFSSLLCFHILTGAQTVIQLSTFGQKYCCKIIENKLFFKYPPLCGSGNQGNLPMILYGDTLLLLG